LRTQTQTSKTVNIKPCNTAKKNDYINGTEENQQDLKNEYFFFWNTYCNYTNKFSTRTAEAVFHQQLKYEQAWVLCILWTSSWDVL